MPESIEESALIDGANHIQIYVRIVVPLSAPIFATIALFMAVGYWNDWFNALLFIRDSRNYPIMMVLKNVLSSVIGGSTGIGGGQSELPPSQSLQMAIVFACIAPIICVYPFLQKYFAKGIMLGSIKG